jgi:hypothetical protein
LESGFKKEHEKMGRENCMRRILVFSIFMLAASFAFAEPIQCSAGMLASWSPLMLNDQTVSSSGSTGSLDYSFATLGIRAFFDFTYGEASIGYSAAVTQMNVKFTVSGSSMSTNVNMSESLVDLRLIGKYPFYFGSNTLFPLAGLQKYFCLGGSLGGTSFSSDDISDFSPWLLLAGVGGDFKVAQQLYIRTELTAAFSLTSKRHDAYYTGVTYQSSYGWEIQLAAGLGYSF